MPIMKQHCVTIMGYILAVCDSGWGNGRSLATVTGKVSHIILTIAGVEGT